MQQSCVRKKFAGVVPLLNGAGGGCSAEKGSVCPLFCVLFESKKPLGRLQHIGVTAGGFASLSRQGLPARGAHFTHLWLLVRGREVSTGTPEGVCAIPVRVCSAVKVTDRWESRPPGKTPAAPPANPVDQDALRRWGSEDQRLAVRGSGVGGLGKWLVPSPAVPRGAISHFNSLSNVFLKEG